MKAQWVLNASVLLIILLLTGCIRGDEAGEELSEPVTTSTPDNFLQYLNYQYSLPAGDYSVVAATAAAAESGSYTLTVSLTSGLSYEFSGSWTSSAGQDATLAGGNPRHDFSLNTPGGATITLTSASADAYLYLVDQGSDNIRAEDDNSGSGTNARLYLPESKILDATYAEAYYDAIDPGACKRTINGWKTENGFDGATDVIHVIFRDQKDLGYGRDMYMRRDAATGVVSVFVNNFQVEVIEGLEYGDLNLDAALAQDFDHHIGTNAIEFSGIDSNCDGVFDVDVNGDGSVDFDDYITKFYTFAPAVGGDQSLSYTSDLDGRGEKSMPIPCITCHGGRADPLMADGSFPRLGDTGSHMHGLEVSTFGFADSGVYTRENMEADLKTMNTHVLCSYPYNASLEGTRDTEDGDGLTCRPNAVSGFWQGDKAATVLKEWYGGDGLPNAEFLDEYVPDAWKYDPNDANPPSGAEQVYRNVIAEDCRTCHVLRGTQNQSQLDFSTYAGFENYSAYIQELIFDNGQMPAAQLPFDDLWLDGSPGHAELLASFVTDFDRFDSSGTLLEPGRPLANPGPDRVTTSPAYLSATASRYADSYSWRIVSTPTGAVATLDSSSSVRPLFTTDTNGAYEIQLTVGNGVTESDPESVFITINNSMTPKPDEIVFSDIVDILQDNATPWRTAGRVGSTCTDCHAQNTPTDLYGGTLTAGVPVVWDNSDRDDDGDVDSDDLHQFYLDVITRVNFADPEKSRILLKPTSNGERGNGYHNGNLIDGFDINDEDATFDAEDYYVVMNWILNGAPEN